MGFNLKKVDGGIVPPWEYIPAEAITPKVGLALRIDPTSGQAEVAALTAKAEYICQREESAAVTAGTVIPAIRINSSQVWEVQQATEVTATVGDKLDVAAGGLGVSAAAGSTDNVQLMSKSSDGKTVEVRFV